MTKKGEIKFAENFFEKLSVGANYDPSHAIFELIDNAIGAKAEKIDITIKDGEFTITDEGPESGMDEVTLIENYFCGGRSKNEKDGTAPGKFGIGGKTGMVYLMGDKATTMTIVTHKRGMNPLRATWYASGKSYEYDLLLDESIPYGTKINFSYGRDISIDKLVRDISIYYCWHITDGLKITVNGRYVVAEDPLYRSNENVIREGIFSKKTFSLKNKEKIEVNITRFYKDGILPSEELHSFDKGSGKKRNVRVACRSGIYLRTAGRYYTIGDNFDAIMGGTNHASLDGLRVEVVVPKTLWNILGISWNKGYHINSFKSIELFDAIGLNEYIKKVMDSYKKMNKKDDGKDDREIKKFKNAIIGESRKYLQTNDRFPEVEVVKSGTERGYFAKFKNNVLTFDISKPFENKKETIITGRDIVVFVSAANRCGTKDAIINGLLSNYRF